MKIPFITGGEKCECKGKGRIEVLHEIGLPLKDDDGSALVIQFWTEKQCPCVQAHEATVERRGGAVCIGDPNIPVRQGTVVAKGVGVKSTTVLAQDAYEEEGDAFRMRMHLKVPTGTRCSICGEPQFRTPSGDTCENDHGGVPPMEDGT